MSKIFKASLIIGAAFGVNKILALGRQYLIIKEFGFSPEIDAFNVANNMPDLIFSLFAGGALAMAFIPVFAEYLNLAEQDQSWKLFSKVVSLLFLVTTAISLLVAALAPTLVRSQFGIAPGFSEPQQDLVVSLLRINLIATIIFSVSGIITASLQAHKHFLLPAIAPIFYNLGIVFGAVVLSPIFGIYGLTYGVVLGAILHFLIQLPGLKKKNFRFTFSLDLHEPGIRKVFHLMWPRLLTVLLIQVTFLLRDNFASRLAPGSISALTYGYFIMQVPETLIGSSIAIALLPTFSSLISEKKYKEFTRVLSLSIRVLIAASLLPIILSLAILNILVELVFHFPLEQTHLLVLTTQAFMVGLLAQTLLEVFVRAFYAKQRPLTPLYATAIRTLVFVCFGYLLYKSTGVVGIAAIDSISVVIEAALLFVLLLPTLHEKAQIAQTVGRVLAGSVLGVAVAWIISSLFHISPLIQVSVIAIAIVAGYTVFVTKEIKALVKL